MKPLNLTDLLTSRRTLVAVLFGGLILAGICLLIKSGQSLLVHGDNTFPESAVVQTAIWARQTGNVYPGLNAYPYTPAPYGPLLYLTLAFVGQVSNAGFWQLLIGGRLVVFSCFLLLVPVAYFCARRLGARPLFALVTCAFILGQVDFLDWNISVRPDMVALLLTLVALVVLLREEARYRDFAVPGALLALAVQYKQSYIALPIAVGLWLLSTRRVRLLVVFGASAAAVMALVLGLLLLKHEPFLAELTLARYSMLSLSGALVFLKTDLLRYPYQGLLVGFAVIALVLSRNVTQRWVRLVTIYSALAVLSAFYVSLAPGAAVNAYLEVWALASILSAVAVQRLYDNWDLTPRVCRAALLIVLACNVVTSMDTWRVQLSVPNAEFAPLETAVQGKRILADLPYLAAQSESPELMDPSVNHYLELAGHWSPQPILDNLDRKQYEYVVIGLNGGHLRQWRGLTLFSSSILKAVSRNYTLACTTNRLAVFVAEGNERRDAARDALQQAGCNQTGTSDGNSLLNTRLPE